MKHKFWVCEKIRTRAIYYSRYITNWHIPHTIKKVKLKNNFPAVYEDSINIALPTPPHFKHNLKWQAPNMSHSSHAKLGYPQLKSNFEARNDCPA